MKIILFLCVLLCFSPVFLVKAEWVDEEEDIAVENQEEKSEAEEAKHQARQKRQRLRQWLKQLEAFKRSKKERVLVDLVSKILNEDPDNIQALNTLGAFYLQNGKTLMAKIIFTRALKKHPKNSSLHNNLAVIALKENKKKDAVEAFQKSLSYRYSNYSAGANLGALYMQAYEYDLALDRLSMAYSRAKQYLPLNHYELVKTGNNYAVALAWSGDFRKSRVVFEELIAKNPKVVELALNYAILLGRDLKRKSVSARMLNKADLMDTSGRYTRNIKALKKYLRAKQGS